ncbi:MAG: mechanosensitive ion channel family protein [Planctomycetota bacterium]|jgi:small-conductance mechanosensitive channel
MKEAVRQRDRGRPLLKLPPSLARHSYLTFHVILLYSAIFITIIGVLGSFGPGTQELLWRAYSISILTLFIWFVAPKHLFLSLLFPPTTKLRRFQRGCIHVAQPLTIAFLVFLIVLNSLGFVTMTYTLAGTIINSVITIVAVAVARTLITALILDRINRKRVAAGIEPGFKITRGIVDYSSVIICIGVILGLWSATFFGLSRSPAAPASLTGFVSQVDHVWEVVVKVMGYRLGMGGEAYTTPLNITIGLIFIAVFFLVAAGVKGLLVMKLFAKVGVDRGVGTTISSVITYLIIAFSILFALSIAGVPLRSLAFFAGALGIGIGFGMQGIVNNFLSGIIMLFERPIRVGDVVVLENDVLGSVERIGPRSTTIHTPDNVMVMVPNAKLMEANIVNWSQPTNLMRATLHIGVAYGSDLKLVTECLLNVLKENPRVKKYPEAIIRFNEFGDSYYDFQLIYWVANARERWFSMSELNFAIEGIFKEHNVEIPFPKRDLNICSIPPKIEGMIKDSTKGPLEEKKGKEETTQR